MPVYTLDRYRNGALMAEGAQVRAASEQEAIAKAATLFAEPSCQDDTFKVVVVDTKNE